MCAVIYFDYFALYQQRAVNVSYPYTGLHGNPVSLLNGSPAMLEFDF